MSLRPFPAIIVSISEFLGWFCRQVMNALHTLFCWLHVFDHVKNVCSFYHIQCSPSILKSTNKKIQSMGLNAFECFCVPQLEICKGLIFLGRARPEKEIDISVRTRPSPKEKRKFQSEPDPVRNEIQNFVVTRGILRKQ